MAFEQYTRCIEPSRYVPRSYAIMAAQAAILASLALPFALAAGHPLCLLIVAEILGLIFTIAYCRNFLYERLICLGGDRDVIGTVVSVSPPPGALAFDWDNDYSINLLLENTEFGVSQAKAEQSQPYGELVAPQDVITNPPVSRTTPGHPAVDEFGTGLRCWGLHAEFEGAGNYNLLQIAQGMLGVAVGAFIACLFAPFPIDLILVLFPLLGFLVGAITSKFVRPGSPSDVNVSTIHVNNEDNEGHGKGADILYVQGTWVYDPLHAGWNEIHPIKVCTKIGTWDGDWPTQPPNRVIERLRDHLQVAQAEDTRANQELPEHQWEVHPDIDGCAADVID